MRQITGDFWNFLPLAIQVRITLELVVGSEATEAHRARSCLREATFASHNLLQREPEHSCLLNFSLLTLFRLVAEFLAILVLTQNLLFLEFFDINFFLKALDPRLECIHLLIKLIKFKIEFVFLLMNVIQPLLHFLTLFYLNCDEFFHFSLLLECIIDNLVLVSTRK